MLYPNKGQSMSPTKNLDQKTYKYISENAPEFSFEIPEFKNWQIKNNKKGVVSYNPVNLPIRFEVPPLIGFLPMTEFNKYKSKELADWKTNPQKVEYKKFFLHGFEKEVLKFKKENDSVFVLMVDDVSNHGLVAKDVEAMIIKTFDFLKTKPNDKKEHDEKNVKTHTHTGALNFSFNYPLFDQWDVQIMSPTIIRYQPKDTIPVDFSVPPNIAIIFETKLKESKYLEKSDWITNPNKHKYKNIFVHQFEKEALLFQDKTKTVVILLPSGLPKYGLLQDKVRQTIIGSFQFAK